MIERVFYVCLAVAVPITAAAQDSGTTAVNNVTIPILVALSAIVFVAGISWKLSNEIHSLREAIAGLKLEIAEERAPKKDVDKLWKDHRALENEIQALRALLAVWEDRWEGRGPSMGNIPTIPRDSG